MPQQSGTVSAVPGCCGLTVQGRAAAPFRMALGSCLSVEPFERQQERKDGSGGMEGKIVALTLAAVALGAGYAAYRNIRRKVRQFSRAAFGTSDLLQGLQGVERESEVTPKSVSAATSICLPNILRDFPEFQYDEMKRRAENVLTSFLRALDEQDESRLTEGTSELKGQLALRIGMLKDEGRQEHYEDIRIHRTEIASYRKDRGRCSVVFQTALQYRFWVERDGQVVEGAREKLRQCRYNVELLYIQDRDLVENQEEAGLAMNCPNCGAPLPQLGAKVCAYCGSPVVAFNLRIWNFSNLQEVR